MIMIMIMISHVTNIVISSNLAHVLTRTNINQLHHRMTWPSLQFWVNLMHFTALVMKLLI